MLTDYQNADYTAAYRAFVEEISGIAGHSSVCDTGEFVRTVALGLAKVMAYKDEYEVACLQSDPRFREAMAEQFEGDFRMSYYLAPPLLIRTDPGTSRPRKIRYGAWAGSLFCVLRRFMGLRGTVFDPFGYSAERREERAMIGEYQALVREVAGCLTSANLAAATQLVGAVMDVRGYGMRACWPIARGCPSCVRHWNWL